MQLLEDLYRRQRPEAPALFEALTLLEELPREVLGARGVGGEVGGEPPYGEKRQAGRRQEGQVEGRVDRLQRRGYSPETLTRAASKGLQV